jgi:hypothetical protein
MTLQHCMCADCGSLLLSNESACGLKSVHLSVALGFMHRSSQYLKTDTATLCALIVEDLLRTDQWMQVNVDVMLELLMATWVQQRRKDCEDIEAAVRSYDPAGRGITSAAGLRGVIRLLDVTLGRDTPDHVVLQLFREGLRHAQGHGSSPHSTGNTIHEAMHHADSPKPAMQSSGNTRSGIPADVVVRILLRQGVLGLRTHRLPPEQIPHQLPWDEFKLIEESWSGMRCEIEQMLLISEQLPTKAPQVHPQHTPAQLRRMVCSSCAWPAPDLQWDKRQPSCCFLHHVVNVHHAWTCPAGLRL